MKMTCTPATPHWFLCLTSPSSLDVSLEPFSVLASASTSVLASPALSSPCVSLERQKKRFSLASKPFFLVGSSSTKRRVVRLWMEPNAMASTVQARQMTLYGMLKSGVGKDTRRDSVYSRRKWVDDSSDSLWGKRKGLCTVVRNGLMTLQTAGGEGCGGGEGGRKHRY